MISQTYKLYSFYSNSIKCSNLTILRFNFSCFNLNLKPRAFNVSINATSNIKNRPAKLCNFEVKGWPFMKIWLNIFNAETRFSKQVSYILWTPAKQMIIDVIGVVCIFNRITRHNKMNDSTLFKQ